MKFVFRADASIDIGSGHVMRCLALAFALKEKGHSCVFICREHKGNLISFIQKKGFEVKILAIEINNDSTKKHRLFHSSWLGATQQQDAQACILFLRDIMPDWIIVDHYALDSEWEEKISVYCKSIFVIDDLVDRKHCCDILLDQTLNRQSIDYKDLVISAKTQVLAGTDFALLRPEFSQWREYSLNRRANPVLKKILVNLGGVDKDNITQLVLEELEKSDLANYISVDVIMGASAPHRDKIEQFAKMTKLAVTVSVNVSNMAEKLAEADLAIGAAGSSSWERCCLGVPTLLLVLANNQNDIAIALDKQSVAKKVDLSYMGNILNTISLDELKLMIEHSKNLVDGKGIQRVLKIILEDFLL